MIKRKYIKRISTLLLSVCMTLSLCACGNQSGNRNSTGKDDRVVSIENQDGKVLIAYFSWADNAEEFNPKDIDVDALGSASVVVPGDVGVIAGYIEQRTKADVFKITLKEKYSADYDKCLEQGREQMEEKARPELMDTVKNIDEYDVIFLGFPNWWYTIPVAVNSFVEAHDLSGKTIIPFVSHGTGGLAGTIQDLTDALPGDCTVEQSYDVFEEDVNQAQDEVNEWLKELGY